MTLKIVFCILGLVGLMGSTPARSQAFGQKNPVLLGQGYAPGPAVFASTCVRGELGAEGAYSFFYAVDYPLATSDILEQMEFDGGGVEGKEWRDQLPTRILTDQLGPVDGPAIDLWYLVKISGRKVTLNRVQLNDLGERMGQQAELPSRYASCGSQFVKSVTLGGMLMIHVQLQFDNQAHAATVRRDLIPRQLGLKQLTAELNRINSEYKRKMRLGVTAFQWGGNPQKLVQTIGVGVDQALSCDSDHMEACLKAFDGWYQYATKATEFSDQIIKGVWDPQKNDGAVAVNLTTDSYRNVGLAVLDTEILDQDLLQDRDRRLEQRRLYFDLSQDLKLVEYQLARTDILTSDVNRMKPLRDTINSNRVLVGKTLDACYVSHSGCAKAWQDQSKLYKSYDKAVLIPVKNFIDFCLGADNSFPVEKTISGVLRHFDLTRSADACWKAHNAMRIETQINLSNLELRNLAPLSSMESLFYLDVGQNQISDLSELRWIPQLKYLKAGQNQLEHLDFRQLPGLEKINLDDNPLRDVAGTLPKKLNELSAFGVRWDDESAVRKALSTVPRLYFNDDDVCAYERLDAFKRKLIDQSLLDFYVAANFVPRYEDQQRMHIENWYACVVLVDTFERFK